MSARCMKKGFVFLLQRFSLAFQEREYIRVRGFHLVLTKRITRDAERILEIWHEIKYHDFHNMAIVIDPDPLTNSRVVGNF